MKTFKEFITEAKEYNKKGRMNVLKTPLALKSGVELLSIGKDVNGNKLVRVELKNGKKKSFQLDSSVTVTIDDVVGGLTDKQINHIMSSLDVSVNEGMALSSRDVERAISLLADLGGFDGKDKIKNVQKEYPSEVKDVLDAIEAEDVAKIVRADKKMGGDGQTLRKHLQRVGLI